MDLLCLKISIIEDIVTDDTTDDNLIIPESKTIQFQKDIDLGLDNLIYEYTDIDFGFDICKKD